MFWKAIFTWALDTVDTALDCTQSMLQYRLPITYVKGAVTSTQNNRPSALFIKTKDCEFVF